jgi:hypothetical protein
VGGGTPLPLGGSGGPPPENFLKIDVKWWALACLEEPFARKAWSIFIIFFPKKDKHTAALFIFLLITL